MQNAYYFHSEVRRIPVDKHIGNRCRSQDGMLLHSCKDYSDTDHGSHIEHLRIQVGKCNENRRCLACKCLDSCRVEKRKDRLMREMHMQRTAKSRERQ